MTAKDDTDDLDVILKRLTSSPFRRRMRLDAHDRSYLDRKGREPVLDHARDFIGLRLAPAQPRNDGGQTPMRGHPVFVAQHATATCCRGCLEKWHGIAAGQALTEAQQAFVVALIGRWLDAEAQRPAPSRPPGRRRVHAPETADDGGQGDLFHAQHEETAGKKA